jgi:hypothetical protein
MIKVNFECDLTYYYLYPSVASSTDILRITKPWQFYRYERNIARFFAGQ